MRKHAAVLDPAEPGSSTRLRAQAALPAVGDSIGGKYTIMRRIGEGGMAVVFEALHVRLGQRLAIKVLRPEVHNLDMVLARFEREARATAMLRSIHTARVIDVDTLENGLPYMVLEYLEGKDLEAELLAAGRLSIAEAVDVVLQVADAMAEAHEQGIVHRDLKPANLFVCRAGDRRVMKILDFGISRDENESSRITAVDSYFGTPSYASPEQLRDASQTDARTDVWSLGVILFELLTGRTPFEGTATQVIAKVVADPIPWPLDLRAEIPRELARLVMRALQRDPAQRFKTMREMSAALAPFGPEKSAAVALATTPGRMRLGEILVSDGLVTRAGLECALAVQQRSGELLGRVLLDLGLVGRADLLAAIAKQQGIHHDSLPLVSIEPGVREAPTVRAPPQLPPLPPRTRRPELVRRALGVPRRLLLLPVAMLIVGAVFGFLIFSMR
jgi:serine/threonine-protein kinase